MLAASMVLNQLYNFIFPAVSQEYLNPSLFRPWTDPLMSFIFIHPFVVGLILAWVWDKTKDLFTDKNWMLRGKKFGLVYWIIFLPGMFISYSTFPVSFSMIMVWSLNGLVQAIVASWVFAKKNP